LRAPSLCRHVHRALMRSVMLDLPPIIAATACHQRNYVERYSRSIRRAMLASQPTGTISGRPLAAGTRSRLSGVLGTAWTCIWRRARWWAGLMRRRVPPLTGGVGVGTACDGRRSVWSKYPNALRYWQLQA